MPSEVLAMPGRSSESSGMSPSSAAGTSQGSGLNRRVCAVVWAEDGWTELKMASQGRAALERPWYHRMSAALKAAAAPLGAFPVGGRIQRAIDVGAAVPAGQTEEPPMLPSVTQVIYTARDVRPRPRRGPPTRLPSGR